MNRPSFALFGPGRLGLRVARRLVALGHACVAVRHRRECPESVRHALPKQTIVDTWEQPGSWDLPRLILVTVPDGAIAAIAAQAASTFDLSGVTVIHTSGLHTSEILAPCRTAGARIASWHPLQSFPSLELGEVPLEGVPCAVEGDPEAVVLAFELATELGLVPWRIAPEHKQLYHASAAVAANLSHILVATAAELLRHCGVPDRGPRHALQPLLDTTVRAALDSRRFAGLTGPIARRDEVTIGRHLEVLPPALAAVYQELARFVEHSD